MPKILPKETANARKLAKIAKLQKLVDDANGEIFANFAASNEMQWWRAQKLQEIVDAEIDSTWRSDEVLWHRLFLARADIAHARNDDERRQALRKYEAAKFDAMAWPDDAAHSRFYSGRHW